MAYTYNTTTKKITVTATSTTRAMYDDVQTTFSGSTYMQYLNPMVGNIKDALYTLANGWLLFDATSLGYLNTGGLIDTAIANRWTNVKTISGDSFTGVQLYYNQTGTPTNFGATGLTNSLLQVRSASSDIAGQVYTVYQRKFGQVYSSFSTTASAGGVDVLPLSNVADPYITLSQATVDAYGDLTIKWETIYRSTFDGASTTKYTLNGAHNNSVTTFTFNELVDASVPSTGTFQVDSEVMTYTGKSGYTLTGVTRGTNDTTAASHLTLAPASTNTKQYDIRVYTSSGSRRLSEIYQWLQSKLTKSTDIDTLAGGHIGQLASSFCTYTGTMVTATGVWVEGFSSLDTNSITYTDHSAATHTSPLSVPVVVNIDASVVGAQVYVASMTTTGLTDATYTPANILAEIINSTSGSTSVSTSIVYTADVPVRVVVRKGGYTQFSLYTTITSTGLNVTAQNPADGTY